MEISLFYPILIELILEFGRIIGFCNVLIVLHYTPPKK